MAFPTEDSPFYLQPEPARDAPQRTIGNQNSASRVIDIVYQRGLSYASIERWPYYVASAAEITASLESSFFAASPNTHSQRFAYGSLDRVYYENNWQYARSLLCRKYIKGVFKTDLEALSDDLREDKSLVQFQMFLNDAGHRDDLDFSFWGIGPTTGLRLHCGKGRLLCHFGFEWIAAPAYVDKVLVHQSDSASFKSLKTRAGPVQIVRRRTCIAAVLKMRSTSRFDSAQQSGLCSTSWESTTPLAHRRTVVLFNELHAINDGLPFSSWLADPSLWTVTQDWNYAYDDETTGVLFVYRLVCQAWEMVLLEWKNAVDKCSDHVRQLEERTLSVHLSVRELEDLALQIWDDTLDWSTLSQLAEAQRNSILAAASYLAAMTRAASITSAREEISRLDKLVVELAEIEMIMSERLPSRGRQLSDLIYQIIAVRQAQAAENYSRELGSLTWISFIAFPLIAIASIFGMNVDTFANNPSIKWYFVWSVPITVVVLATALITRRTYRAR